MRQMFKVVMAAVLVASLCLGSVARGFAQEATGRPFITKWQGKAGEELRIPIVGTEYKLVIKDEQGKVVTSEEKVTVEGTDASFYHAFTPSADGVYTVEAGPEGVKYMRMKTEREYGNDLLLTSNAQLLEVMQFGTVAWESMKDMFRKCRNMTFAAGIDTPDLTKVTNMSEMFWSCERFNQPLNHWNVSNVTDMHGMFHFCRSFNQPLNNWNVSNVTDMSRMFQYCWSFNQPLNNWNVSQVTNMSWMFYECFAFNQPLNDWEVSKVTNMSHIFAGYIAFNQPLEKWDVSQVTNMSYIFAGCSAFNQPLEKWNVSQVTDMSWMFGGCSAFNQPLEKWNVSQVTDMSGMFGGCSAFNQPLEKWNVSQVTDMRGMFKGCTAFNQPLEKWDVSKVTNMSWMFERCLVFNQPLEKWDVSNVTNMGEMFYDCSAFNQLLEKWNVSKVTNMSGMFGGCKFFNQPLEKWDVSKVTEMSGWVKEDEFAGMFKGCTAFNQPLEKWDVSKVTNMSWMFSDCTAFNQPLEKWDVSKVTNMSRMFSDCTAFNQPLEKWDVSKVTWMSKMFQNCSSFNQPLEKWDVSNVTNMGEMFEGCKSFNQPLGAWKLRTAIGGLSSTAMSAVNYSLSLIGWAKQTDGASNIPFGEEVKGLVYNDAGKEARKKLIARGWTFEGDVYKPSEKVAISLAKEGEGTLAIEGYNDAALQAVAVGTELTVTATPQESYTLTALTAGTQDILATKKFTVTGAVTVKAVFTKNGGSNPGGGTTTFAVTLAQEGEGTLAIEGYNDETLQTVEEGTELTVIATPKEGYTLTSLTAGSQDILAEKKFTVTEAMTVKAVFKKKAAITLVKEGEGTLAIEGYNDDALKAVAVGTALTVIATPKEGYTLTSLMAGTQDILATKKFMVTGAVEVKAVFKKNGNNGGGNGGGGWQPQTPQAVEDAVLASVAVAPNPFTSQLRIENPEGVVATYELVNAAGVVVRAGAFDATEEIVDTEALPAGLYLVRLMSQNGAKRVVKVFKY